MLGFMSVKKHEEIMHKEIMRHVDITRFWQNKYSEAIQSQNTLNAMLKEATSHEKTTHCSNCNNIVSVRDGIDNRPLDG